MAASPAVSWESLWGDIVRLRRAIRQAAPVKVNDNLTRDFARQIVQGYFRVVRPELTGLGLDGSAVDAQMQSLLSLTAGQSRRTAYLRVLRELEGARRELEVRREIRLGERANELRREVTEGSILDTLRRMVPRAALCYEQALSDLTTTRVSYRGAAAELRESLKEVLDHLAPDEIVTRSPGFKLEEGQDRPTMRQKARFILKARGQGETARKVVEESASVVDEHRAGAARAAHQRASTSVHTAASPDEVRQLKRYVDAVLCELLEIR